MRDHRMLAVQLLQVGVAPVLRVARAVVGQGHDLVRGLVHAHVAALAPYS
jgi:hypothetical protein